MTAGPRLSGTHVYRVGPTTRRGRRQEHRMKPPPRVLSIDDCGPVWVLGVYTGLFDSAQ